MLPLGPVSIRVIGVTGKFSLIVPTFPETVIVSLSLYDEKSVFNSNTCGPETSIS